MSTASKLLVLALATLTLATTAPRPAEACGPYGMTPAQLAAIKLQKSERQRLAKIRAKRADRCVVASIVKISEEERQEMSDLPWGAQQRRSVAIHYPLFSENGYRMSEYMNSATLNRYGFTWSQLNSKKRLVSAYLALRPAGNDEWMVVDDFKSECPQPEDVSRTHLQNVDLL